MFNGIFPFLFHFCGRNVGQYISIQYDLGGLNSKIGKLIELMSFSGFSHSTFLGIVGLVVLQGFNLGSVFKQNCNAYGRSNETKWTSNKCILLNCKLWSFSRDCSHKEIDMGRQCAIILAIRLFGWNMCRRGRKIKNRLHTKRHVSNCDIWGLLRINFFILCSYRCKDC